MEILPVLLQTYQSMSDSLKKHPLLACITSGNASARSCEQTGAMTERFENKENMMGKYFLGWILGVPAIVLVLIYFFMH